MKCTICEEIIAIDALFVKDYYLDKIVAYHLDCHENKFRSNRLTQVEKLTESKSTHVESVGTLANWVFMIILLIAVIFGIFAIVWLVI